MQEENKVKKSFHQNMKAELKKVIWPTGKQTIKSTFATIGFVLLISVILVALNYVFSAVNAKWFDLVLGNDEKPTQENELVISSGDTSDDISGDIVEEIMSGEIESVEKDVTNENIDSGDENIVTE